MVKKTTLPDGQDPVRTGTEPAAPPADAVRTAPGGPGQVESLDALSAEAKALQAPPAAPQGAGGGGKPPVDAERAAREARVASIAEDFADLLQSVREGVDPIAVESNALREGQVAAIWTDKRLQNIAYPLAVLADRHGMDSAQALERYGPWLMLAAGVAVPAFATYKAIRANQADAPAAT